MLYDVGHVTLFKVKVTRESHLFIFLPFSVAIGKVNLSWVQYLNLIGCKFPVDRKCITG